VAEAAGGGHEFYGVAHALGEALFLQEPGPLGDTDGPQPAAGFQHKNSRLMGRLGNGIAPDGRWNEKALYRKPGQSAIYRNLSLPPPFGGHLRKEFCMLGLC
jgi:hypothetical protein